ncbi:hypothetical protein K439DRAFT_1626777 [Ramaria rubella]|nr:hypothetical protein K439DRAFT_1626777 [Ramaria rubella]
MLMLDFVNYTTLDGEDNASSSSSTASLATPSGGIDSQQKGTDPSSKKNSATFGIAIGSTMGVLAVISFTVCVSIWRRRRKSAKRNKRIEAEEAANRPASPEMRGPQPFIPRYFPGSVVPTSSLSHRSLSRPSSLSGGSDEIGPSHGLDFPPAPEHLANVPAYSPPPLVLPAEQDETDAVPPRYQDVGRTPLVSILPLTQITIPPDLDESPSSSVRSGGAITPTSTTLLFPERSELTQEGSAARLDSGPTIHVNERPG